MEENIYSERKPGRHSGQEETRAEEWGVILTVVVVGRVASKVCCTCISRTKSVAKVRFRIIVTPALLILLRVLLWNRGVGKRISRIRLRVTRTSSHGIEKEKRSVIKRMKRYVEVEEGEVGKE